jgi:hypothetical protein
MRVPKKERAIGCMFECEEGLYGCQIYQGEAYGA